MKSDTKKILIIGINGFIGSHLAAELLKRRRYEVYGLDLYDFRILHLLGKDGFFFTKGDIYKNWDLLEEYISHCDVVVPLAAIAQPKLYIQEPLQVFELDFEANLKIIQAVVKHNKFLLFPSTSEVYGKVRENYFNEDTTDIVVGPINEQRWIYSTIKQLLDRLIHAYGLKEGLRYCCFRPFNWIGSGLDSIKDAQNGTSRVVTSFISMLLMKEPVKIVGDGKQSRCFTDIKDGVDCLIRIIDNSDICDKQIINIGNPYIFLSVYELALKCIETFKKSPKIPEDIKEHATYKFVSREEFYGKGYDDIFYRKPSIEKAKTLLDWKPSISIEDSLEKCIDHLFHEWKDLNGNS